MKYIAAIGTMLVFSIFWMPGLAEAAPGGAEEATLFEYKDGSWLEVGTSEVGSARFADLNQDQYAEKIFGAVYGEEPTVRIEDIGGQVLYEFAAYDSGMRKGFDLAVGNLDGSGEPEIITSAGPGTNGHVRILNRLGEPKFFRSGIFPFGRGNNHGAFVGVADLDGDSTDELLIGSGVGSQARVQVWSGIYGFMGEFAPFEESPYGVRVTGADVNGDGLDEIVASQAYGGGRLRVFDGRTFEQLAEYAPFGAEFEGGLKISAVHMDNPGVDGLAISRNGETIENRPWLPQYVVVDVSRQRLHAYEFGHEINSFWVSTGRWDYPTPFGEFKALAKPEYVHYMWSYGEDDPENYDLGVVRWNVRFYPHIYIHYAPWHNNFGYRMSHGCVNANRTNAEWIYNWIELGTPITVKY